MGPPVKEIMTDEDLEQAKRRSELFFVYVGRPALDLWNEYFMVARHFQRDEFMYTAASEFMAKHIKLDRLPAVYIYKDNNYFLYEEKRLLDRNQRSAGGGEERNVATGGQMDEGGQKADVSEDGELNNIENSSLSIWVTRERFPLFVKITRGRFGQILATRKLIVIVVLEENKLEQITPEMETFREMVRGIVESNPTKYQESFQFGWTGLPDLANSVAMETLETPSLLVVDSVTFHHYIPQARQDQ